MPTHLTFSTTFSRTVSFLVRYPLLGLPVLGALLASFILRQVLTVFWEILSPLLRDVIPDTGILGGIPRSLSEDSLLTLPILVPLSFLQICFYASALFAIAAMVRLLLQRLPLDLWASSPSLPWSLRRLLLFSLIMLGLCAVAGAINSFTIRYFMRVHLSTFQLLYAGVSFGTSLLVGGAVIAPAIQLLRPPGAARVTLPTAAQGYIFVFLSLVANRILFFAVFSAAAPLIRHSSSVLVLYRLLSFVSVLLSTVPYTFLAVALSLLAANPVQIDPAPSKQVQAL